MKWKELLFLLGTIKYDRLEDDVILKDGEKEMPLNPKLEGDKLILIPKTQNHEEKHQEET